MRVRDAGFTLIELMVTVAIIGILASIAYPSYTRYVQEARRTDAKSMLMQVAGRLERCYTVSNTYQDSECPSGTILSDEGYYSINISTSSSSKYTLTATPVVGKSQDKDNECAQFIMTQTGMRTSKNSSGNESGCW